MRNAITVSLTLTLAVACVPPLPEGHYACVVAATDCPTGWSCVGGRCYSSAPFAGGDAGVFGGDAAWAPDAWSAPMADAATVADAGVVMPDTSVAAPDAGREPDAAAPVDAGTIPPTDAGGVAPPPSTALAVGSRHACAATAAGVVACWGDNANGGLGVPVATPWSATPVVVPSVPESHDVCAGNGYACALGADGRVRCWGNDSVWQLGRNAVTPAPPDVVPGVSGATQITCGGTHACALTAAGVMCWGGNAAQQTGAAASPREMPHLVAGVHAVAITAGASHTCALSGDGTVSCWGAGSMGQLGASGPTPSSSASSAAPVAIPGLSAVAIAAGSDHTCAAQGDGSVSCWGCANSGRLGVLASGAHPALVTVTGVSGTLLVAGGTELSCAASSAPTMPLGCWGNMAYGQLGTGGSAHTGVATSPTPISSMPGPVTSLAAGNGFACAAAGAAVLCWGLNDRGQLGDGTTTTRTAPVMVTLP